MLEVPPADQGAPFIPGVRQVDNLPLDYVEEEYFIAGEATLYSYANNPPQGPTDLSVIASDVPYKTRVILRRPAKSNKFNGTVVIEWFNSTANFDTAPVWHATAQYFAENGIANECRWRRGTERRSWQRAGWRSATIAGSANQHLHIWQSDRSNAAGFLAALREPGVFSCRISRAAGRGDIEYALSE